MKTLVLGLGNVLMGDEGIGVYAVRMVEQMLAGLAAGGVEPEGKLSVWMAARAGLRCLSRWKWQAGLS